MDTVFDPLRKKSVPLTPEEKVRQWFITVLRDTCKVPLSHMQSEYSFSLGEKPYRADIMMWNKDGAPLAVVECKRPDVQIDAKVLDQAVRYNMALNLDWLFLTNGLKTVVLKKQNDAFTPVKELPDYERMLSE